MKVYKENLERFDTFYKSDFYRYLEKNNSAYISSVFESLSEDPDNCDSGLYKLLGEKFDLPTKGFQLIDKINEENIYLTADIVCGQKQIANFYNKDYSKWRDDYKLIRSNINLHFVWPKHKSPTINTYRYTKYLDRIDCLLFDIKCYFDGIKTPMYLVYQQEKTAIWLRQFNGDFKYFIEKMKLNSFVNKNYDVLDISNGQLEILDKILLREEILSSLEQYMENLLKLNRNGKF